MTAQIHDTVIFEDREFDLVGVRGRHLPVPEDFGIVVRGVQSSCHQGFTAAYLVEAGELQLAKMTVHGVEDKYPTVAGAKTACLMPFGWPSYKSPRPATHHLGRGRSERRSFILFFAAHAVAFSGRLLIARDFDRARYVHMGFQSPSAFRDVRLVTLDAGRVIEARLLARAQVERCSRPKDEGGRGGAWDWVRTRFSLDFADPDDEA